jgi:hypothetical protein
MYIFVKMGVKFCPLGVWKCKKDIQRKAPKVFFFFFWLIFLVDDLMKLKFP